MMKIEKYLSESNLLNETCWLVATVRGDDEWNQLDIWGIFTDKYDAQKASRTNHNAMIYEVPLNKEGRY
jgi:hypothetical protein